MGYAIFCQRKLMLTNRINKINFQLMCLSEMESEMANQMANDQRKMSAMNMLQGIGQMYNSWNGMKDYIGNQAGGTSNYLGDFINLAGAGFFGFGGSNPLAGFFGGSSCNGGGYNGADLLSFLGGSSYPYNNYSNNFFQQQFPKLAMEAMIEDDIEEQKKQLETQLKVAQQELESVEKGEEAAIKSATPKYA